MCKSFKFWLLSAISTVFLSLLSVAAAALTAQPAATGNRPKVQMRHERILSFDTKEFPLCELVADALDCHPNELGQLHLLREPEDYCEQGKIRAKLASTRTPLRRVELLRRALTTKWKMSNSRKQWENDFLPRIVRDVVGTEVMENEQQLIYQRSPMLRFHVAWPLEPEEVATYDHTVPPLGGRNPGTLAGLHTDEEYGHPPGETNFFLPVTLSQTFGTNSLYVEGDVQRGDFEPFELSYGEMMMWNGNTFRHCSPRNISNQTRISFDFRVIAGSDWTDPPKEKKYFQLGGYYLDANSV